jgi:hypothetical protein
LSGTPTSKTWHQEIRARDTKRRGVRKYALPAEILLPLYVELDGRDEFPIDAECALLGDAKALKIHKARETLFRAMKKAGSHFEAAQIKDIVAKKLGLNDAAAGNGAGMCVSIFFSLGQSFHWWKKAVQNGANAQEDRDSEHTSTDGRPAV